MQVTINTVIENLTHDFIETPHGMECIRFYVRTLFQNDCGVYHNNPSLQGMKSVVIPTEKQGLVFPQAQRVDLPNFSWVSSLRKSVGKYWEDDG